MPDFFCLLVQVVSDSVRRIKGFGQLPRIHYIDDVFDKMKKRIGTPLTQMQGFLTVKQYLGLDLLSENISRCVVFCFCPCAQKSYVYFLQL